MKRRTARRPGEPGAALLLAVVFTFVLIGVGAVLVDYVVQGFRLTHTDYDGVRAHAQADAGIDLALDVLTRADIDPANDADPPDPSLVTSFNDGWNFRGTITRDFESGTYTVTSAGSTATYTASDVLPDAEGGFTVTIRDNYPVPPGDTYRVEVESVGWVGPSAANPRARYRAVAQVRAVLQPMTDAIRARGMVKINGGGTLAVRLRDGAGVEAVPYGQRGHADAHVRSASGIITGNCDIDGAATVYDDNYISGTVDAVEYNTGDPQPPDLLPSDTEMEAARQRWLAAADAHDSESQPWGPDLRTLAGYNTPGFKSGEFRATGHGGGTYTLSDTGALTVKSGLVEIKAPAHFASITVVSGATLRIRAAANTAENVVYVGSGETTVPSTNTNEVVTIDGPDGTLENEVALVVNGRMTSAGAYRATSAIATNTERLSTVALVVLGDDRNSGQPALTLRSANSATEAAGMIYSAGSAVVNGNGYIVGGLMVNGEVVLNGSNAHVNFPVNLFPPPGFEKAKVVAYHAERIE